MTAGQLRKWEDMDWENWPLQYLVAYENLMFNSI